MHIGIKRAGHPARGKALGSTASLALALGLAGLPIQARGFDPIPHEVWAMKEDPEHGVKGAVILDDNITFTGGGIEHLIRVRVLSEAGRGAAEIRDLAPEAGAIEGRTSYPDGTSVPFDQRKDLSEKRVSANGAEERETKVLLPPGVTSNCVVEMRWSESALANAGQQLPASLRNGATFKLGSGFKILRAEITFGPFYTWSFAVVGTRAVPTEKKPKDRPRTFIFRDIPAYKVEDFSSRALADLPTFSVWHGPRPLLHLSSEPDAFWDQVAQWLYQPYYRDRIEAGKKFEAMAADLLHDLPASPRAKAVTIMARLDRRVRNMDFPTFQEKADETRKSRRAASSAKDLEAAATSGYATSEGMLFCYLALLGRAGLTPVLGMVANRYQTLFQYEEPNPYQFHRVLVGIREPGLPTVWVDPSLRFAQPGLINPNFQGTEALVVDTGTWKSSRETLGIQNGQFNASQYQINLKVGPEEDHFQVRATFAGHDEWLERRKYLALDAPEQAKELRDRLEQGVPQSAVDTATVENATDPDKNLTWTAEGSIAHADGAQRRIDPFPGMGTPIFLPKAWPERRNGPILLNRLFSWAGASRIQVRPGTTVPPVSPIAFANSFGTVRWKAVASPKDGGTQLDVTLKVEVQRLIGPPEAYAELKAFIDAVKQAYHQTIVLEKP